MFRKSLPALIGLMITVPSGFVMADDSDGTDFARDIRPFLRFHCVDCHSGDEPEGGVSLETYEDSARVQTDFEVWEKVLRVLDAREMPPEDSPQPPDAEYLAVIGHIEAELATFDCTGPPSPGRVTIRRLNQVEYNNTIRDLVGIDFQPADDFPSDDVGNGFDNIGDVLTISPLLMEKYFDAAESIADRVLADKDAFDRLIIQKVQDDDLDKKIAAAQVNLRAFASRAFRRPVSDEELERLFGLVLFAFDQGSSDEEIWKSVLSAVLTSPHFLFRVEHDPDPGDEDGIRSLDDYELASRLSYFLWSTMPDEELIRLAGEGTLHEPEVLKAQVGRMLDDPMSISLVDNFAGQWLQLRDLAHLQPDPSRFPSVDETLRADMRRETELLFETIMRENRSVLDLLRADFTFVNERLASHYGMPDVTGEQFQRVILPDNRRGVLTHASVLLLTSNPTRTSPVKRGKWILDNILGEPPPLPPAGVEELKEADEALGSLRERLAEHRENVSCAVCHRRMDPLGFGLENFDAVGAWRDQDGPYPIDSSGTLPGDVQFNGPVELINILVESKRDAFCRCLAEKLLTYALGRGLSSQDRCAVDKILEEARADDDRFRTLIEAIVTSDPFLSREAQKD
ncbi:MAG: DUF1592 domain-containing protein [Planctomycetaceae bacterium]|nr:DUF1592 domain-containing protein [Planctomycetaceae bacterium]